MENDFKTIYEKVRDVAFNTRKGIANSATPLRFVEQAKNVLYNNMDEIEEALKYASEASDNIRILEVELSDAERELDELTKKTTPKKKGSSKADE